MQRNKVGPAQVPNKSNMWKGGRVQSGMSMEDLKHQTALRLANEQRDDPSAKDEANGAGRQHHHYMPQPRQQLHSPPYQTPQYPAQSHSNYLQRYNQQKQYDSRNYTDSQLGVPAGSQPLFSSTANNSRSPNNSYSTPRNKHAPLQDRGSAENRSVDGDIFTDAHATGGAVMNSIKVASPLKGRVASNSNLKSSSSLSKKRTGNRMDHDVNGGRVSPVRNVDSQRMLYSTSNTHREVSTPTSVYSEPNRNPMNRSPRPSSNNLHAPSPDYHKRSTNTPSNTPFYKNAQQQRKMPHGLTVQELKEMTRARLAAEANYEGDSVQSGGTGDGQQERKSPQEQQQQYVLPPPLPGQGESYGISYRKSSADGISISSGASSGNLNGRAKQQGHVYQSHQGQTSHQRMQVTTKSAGDPMQYPYPRHASPVYQQQKLRTDTWDNLSVASTLASDYQVPDMTSQVNAPAPGFSSPTSISFNPNRGRCFSAGATITSSPVPSSNVQTSSWEEQNRIANQDYRPPSMGVFYASEEVNRRRCATMSPPGMSRWHEDRPFLFSGDEKEKLAIPPLSEPRRRFNTTGILGNGFEPISIRSSSTRGSRIQHPQVPPSPPSLSERVQFNEDDRMMSTGSNGDLPSSVAEAVLESLTASTGPVDLFDTNSLFRPSANDNMNKFHFRKSPQLSLDRIVTESSGGGSLFSNEPSQKSFFTSDYSKERVVLGTNSWDGEVSVGEDTSTSFGFSQEFNNLLIGNDGPALRGRAQTAPCFGKSHPFVSQLDPEHNFEDRGSAMADASSMMLGFGRSTNLPLGCNKPNGSD